jgi:hypothetical protein
MFLVGPKVFSFVVKGVLCSIVVVILKMVTGRNFSMSGINSWHHYLPTYQIFMISDHGIDSWHQKISTGRLYQNGHHNTAQIQHCLISTTFQLWVDYDVPNWFLTLKNFYRSPFSKWWPVEIFQCWESIRDIIIYPHIKFLWYRTMLNFYRPFFIPCFGSHFENGRHLEH